MVRYDTLGTDRPSGGVAERTKAAVLKTVVPQGTVGSNPTSSAIFIWGAFGDQRKGGLSRDKKLSPCARKTDSLLTTVKNQIIIKLSISKRKEEGVLTTVLL